MNHCKFPAQRLPTESRWVGLRLKVAGVYQLTAYPRISLTALAFMTKSGGRDVTGMPTPVDAFTALVCDGPTEYSDVDCLHTVVIVK
jgi:hypothetical protein